MGGGGVKNYQKLRDVIYGRPLIRLEVSPPSFDTSAWMKYMCGPQLNQIIDKDFG
jgi:hypothetical protein